MQRCLAAAACSFHRLRRHRGGVGIPADLGIRRGQTVQYVGVATLRALRRVLGECTASAPLRNCTSMAVASNHASVASTALESGCSRSTSPKLVFRLADLAGLDVGLRQTIADFDERVEKRRGAKLLDGFRQTAGLLQHQRQIPMRLGAQRRQPDGFLVLRNCLVHLARLGEAGGEVVVDGTKIRVDPQRFAVMRHGAARSPAAALAAASRLSASAAARMALSTGGTRCQTASAYHDGAPYHTGAVSHTATAGAPLTRGASTPPGVNPRTAAIR